MNKFLFWLMMLPSGLYRTMGADVDQLRALLKVKLIMDDRKPLQFGKKGRKKPPRFSSFWTAFISFFTGMIYIFPLLLMQGDRLVALWGYFTYFLFMLSFTLITDFSSVLLDTRDKYVVLPRPVNGKTLLLSRLLHILIYLFRIVVPMALPGWIVMGFMSWKLALWFPLPLLLLVLTSLFIVMLAYLLMLTLTSPARFKNLLNAFQIILSILLFSSYYIVPRLLRDPAVVNLTAAQIPWIQYFPSYWIASTATWFIPFTPHAHTTVLGITAIVLPIVAFLLTVKWLAPRFNAKLAGLDAIDIAESKPAATTKRSSGNTGMRLSKLLNQHSQAQAGFLLAWIQTARSRTFRMRVIPAIAYVPVYFFFLLMNNDRDYSSVWQELPQTARHLGLMYMCAFVLLQALNYLVMSDQYKAAWVYYAAPMPTPGVLLGGAYKAVWLKYFLPFFILISAFVLYIWGLSALPDILLALTNVTLFSVAMARIMYRHFPFSKMEQMKERGTRFFRILLVFAIPATLGGLHYLVWLAGFWWLKLLFALLSMALVYLFWDSYRNTKWAEMKSVAE